MFRSRTATRCVLPGVVIAAFLAGCGGEDPDVTTPATAATTTDNAMPSTATASEASPEAPATSEATAPDSALQAGEVALDASVYFGPHRYDLGTATLEPTDGGGELRVDVVAENISERTADPAGNAVWLSINDLAAGYSADTLSSTPAKAKVAGDLMFDVDETFVMDEAVLHFGELTENSSLVPLNGGPVTTRAAKDVTPPSAASDEMWTITPSAVAVHSQDLWRNSSFDVGQGLMLIDFVATLDESPRSLNISTADFSLTLPDGTSAPATGGGYPGVNESVAVGQSTPTVSIAFTIPLETPGDYVFAFTPDDSEPIQMPFSVE